MVPPSSDDESASWAPISWETVEQEMRDRGQITDSGLAEAKAEQDAYVTGYRLAELRVRAGMTQTEVAETMGVTQVRVSAIERGELDSLTLGRLRAYVGALGGTLGVVATLDDTTVALRLPKQVSSTEEAIQPRQKPVPSKFSPSSETEICPR